MDWYQLTFANKLPAELVSQPSLNFTLIDLSLLISSNLVDLLPQVLICLVRARDFVFLCQGFFLFFSRLLLCRLEYPSRWISFFLLFLVKGCLKFFILVCFVVVLKPIIRIFYGLLGSVWLLFFIILLFLKLQQTIFHFFSRLFCLTFHNNFHLVFSINSAYAYEVMEKLCVSHMVHERNHWSFHQ